MEVVGEDVQGTLYARMELQQWNPLTLLMYDQSKNQKKIKKKVLKLPV
jgi:hypothetical protein